MGLKTQFCSERAEEVDEFLLLVSVQRIEAINNLISFAAAAFVVPNGLNQVGCASIMEEEDALPDTP